MSSTEYAQRNAKEEINSLKHDEDNSNTVDEGNAAFPLGQKSKLYNRPSMR